MADNFVPNLLRNASISTGVQNLVFFIFSFVCCCSIMTSVGPLAAVSAEPAPVPAPAWPQHAITAVKNNKAARSLQIKQQQQPQQQGPIAPVNNWQNRQQNQPQPQIPRNNVQQNFNQRNTVVQQSQQRSNNNVQQNWQNQQQNKLQSPGKRFSSPAASAAVGGFAARNFASAGSSGTHQPRSNSEAARLQPVYNNQQLGVNNNLNGNKLNKNNNGAHQQQSSQRFGGAQQQGNQRVGTAGNNNNVQATAGFSNRQGGDDTRYDQIVVGAGVVGLWAANELAKLGQKVLLLEQFPRVHSRGGSAGSSRAIELTYPIPAAVPTLAQSMKMYEELQYETGIPLIKDTTVLLLTEEPFEKTVVPEVLSNLRDNFGLNLPHMRWNELVERFPGFGFTEESHAVYDNVTAKEFLASRAIYALWTAAEARGVKTDDNCPVTSVRAERSGAAGNVWRVSCKLGGKSFLAKSVVLATGAWTPSIEIINLWGSKVNLPAVTPMLTAQLYFKERPGQKCADVGFMDWQWSKLDDMYAWGRPTYNTQTDHAFLIGMGDKVEVATPSDMEAFEQFQQVVRRTRQYVRQRMPCLDDNPTLIEKAMLYKVASSNFGARPVEGADGLYVAIEGNSFGGAPVNAQKLAQTIVNPSTKNGS